VQETRIGEIAAEYLVAHPEVLVAFSQKLQEPQEARQQLPANKTAEIVSSGQIKINVVAHRPLVAPFAQLRTSESGSLKLASILSWVRP